MLSEKIEQPLKRYYSTDIQIRVKRAADTLLRKDRKQPQKILRVSRHPKDKENNSPLTFGGTGGIASSSA